MPDVIASNSDDGSRATPPAAEGPQRLSPRKQAARGAVEGFVLGGAFAIFLEQLGIVGGPMGLFGPDTTLVLPLALLGAVGGLTRARRLLFGLLWPANAVAVAVVLLVGYTPVAGLLARGLYRTDPLDPAPAVVVLSSRLHQDRTLSNTAQERAAQAYAVLGQGYAPRLVVTCPPSGERAIRNQMRQFGLEYPIDVAGPARDTHGEALAVAALARGRGWDRVILVTHPWHMRRAAAAFEKAGVRVISSPCVEGSYDLSALPTAPDRLGTFRYWLHESAGYWVYRIRGWA